MLENSFPGKMILIFPTFMALTSPDFAHSADSGAPIDGRPAARIPDGADESAPAAADHCCSCPVTDTEALPAPPMLPCTFDFPAGWNPRFGNDGSLISALIAAQCGAACGLSPSQSFTVSTGPDPNAETREEIWSDMMTVVGRANCGDRAVTFFQSPDSDPDGQFGSVRFYVGAGGELYSAIAMFTCPTAGEWQDLRDLFIESFRTNPNSTFGHD